MRPRGGGPPAALARVGLELELLAPRGLARAQVARALADRFQGRVEHGFKYHSEGRLPDGRPLCQLTHASRVRVGRRVLLTLVDDPTVRRGLPRSPAPRDLPATDDVRLALLAERHCWGADASLASRLRPLARLFGGTVDARGVQDPYGHPLVVLLRAPASHQRVCEVVTRPLRTRAERARVVAGVLEVARRLRLRVPAEAALHAHYDAAPWRSTERLGRLVVAATDDRAAWQAALQPNPRCRKLGPFPPEVVRVARARRGVPFPTFAAALHLAGARKEGDLNVLGVIEPRPRQHTLEVRCLPMTLDAGALLARLEAAEALLAPCLG